MTTIATLPVTGLAGKWLIQCLPYDLWWLVVEEDRDIVIYDGVEFVVEWIASDAIYLTAVV